nr:hypothetical protein [Tanacetum cinerariifolium]
VRAGRVGSSGHEGGCGVALLRLDDFIEQAGVETCSWDKRLVSPVFAQLLNVVASTLLLDDAGIAGEGAELAVCAQTERVGEDGA